MRLFSIAAAGSVVLAVVAVAPAIAAAATPEPPIGAQGSELPTRRVDELTGDKVMSDRGEEIGEVDEIVREKTSKKLFAVVSVGGFLGVGEHDVTIALEDLSLQGNRLIAPPGTTREQLKNMPEYDERAFDELPDDQVVTVGSRVGSHGGSGSR